MKIAYQGIAGSYSESCAKEMYPDCETISCKTFDECFEFANNDSSIFSIIPELINNQLSATKPRCWYQYVWNVFLGVQYTSISDIVSPFVGAASSDGSDKPHLWLQAEQ